MQCKIISAFMTLICCTFFLVYLDISSIFNEPEVESADNPRTTKKNISLNIETLQHFDSKKQQPEKEVPQIAADIQTNHGLSITQSPLLPQNVILNVDTIVEEATNTDLFSLLKKKVTSFTVVKNNDITNDFNPRKILNVNENLNNWNLDVVQILASSTKPNEIKTKIKTNRRKKILISKSHTKIIKKINNTKNLLASVTLPSNNKKKPSMLRQPTKNGISSIFGKRIDPINKKVKFHKGVDIASPLGTEVFAWSDGVVTRNGWLRGYGLTIDVTHENGIKTRYAHLMRATVMKGQKIDKGQIIGRVGKTGRTTGTNLHFEVAVAGKISNPLNYLSEIYEIVGNNIDPATKS